MIITESYVFVLLLLGGGTAADMCDVMVLHNVFKPSNSISDSSVGAF